ncbi:probable cyclin-dependent serine/threonine-protein kinase DDB_G0292550 [Hylaeus anthracinus]|uniref:probable cyclin-dependent serine/threonine-protein kinase DDB_G0292550 n=1 Tax=Hylaeus anthracinus TaxID=313031 RepID=UPI0023B9AC3C|nr:probable cyclin-dependent serine/threonine-protein kinase DDB_G0292550 [Hylaeus anthracinus]
MNKKKESKLVAQLNIDKDANVTTRRRSLNMGKKQGYNVSLHHKKASFKQTIKQKNTTKRQKSPKKLPDSNKLLKNKEDTCKHQIEHLNQILKQTSTCPTLTQEELKLLFMKYKLDGHYRTNTNLPPVTSLLNNTNNVIDANSYLYGKTPYTENNLSMHNNLNYMSTNCNIHACNSENILTDGYYKIQSESNLNDNKISDMEEHQSLKYLNKDLIFNAQYEKTDQNLLNLNIYNNCYLNEWNNNSTVSINKCNNFQSWENEHLDCVSGTNNMSL